MNNTPRSLQRRKKKLLVSFMQLLTYNVYMQTNDICVEKRPKWKYRFYGAEAGKVHTSH